MCNFSIFLVRINVRAQTRHVAIPIPAQVTPINPLFGSFPASPKEAMIVTEVVRYNNDTDPRFREEAVRSFRRAADDNAVL